MHTPFTPPSILHNPHVQTALASLGPRKLLTQLGARELQKNCTELILNCGDGTRLLGAYNRTTSDAKGLVTLIHGWEGSIDSAYILSAGSALLRRGYHIFRLNLRDHGKSHHLNRALFTSTRLNEVINAVHEIHRLFPHPHTFLVGFSLGGNFALRIALRGPAVGIRLTGVVAVCPLINPVEATSNLERNHPIYHYYYVRKWQKSLRKKLQYFPELGYEKTLLQLTSLAAMHDYFVPHHTEFQTAHAYLSAYRLTDEQLSRLAVPTRIIASDDDPITRKSDLEKIHPGPSLTIESTEFGGHCGFLRNLRLNSWIDEQLPLIFEQEINGSRHRQG